MRMLHEQAVGGSVGNPVGETVGSLPPLPAALNGTSAIIARLRGSQDRALEVSLLWALACPSRLLGFAHLLHATNREDCGTR